MCSYLPIGVLLERTQHLDINFSMLPKNMFSIFPAKSTILVRDISIIRLQIPMTLNFAISGYKVQRATFQITLLDLLHNSKAGDKSSYKRLCSTYVQLSCLQTLDGVKLLQPITLENIGSKPHAKLQEESLIIDNISNWTLWLWTY